MTSKVKLYCAIDCRIFELKLSRDFRRFSEGFAPAEAFPAITPLAYGERCAPRSRLPDIGPRGLRCGGIIKLW